VRGGRGLLEEGGRGPPRNELWQIMTISIEAPQSPKALGSETNLKVRNLSNLGFDPKEDLEGGGKEIKGRKILKVLGQGRRPSAPKGKSRGNNQGKKGRRSKKKESRGLGWGQGRCGADPASILFKGKPGVVVRGRV